MRWWLPKSSVEVKVAIGFGLALAILVVVGALSYRSTVTFAETAQLVARTQAVLTNIERVHTLANDIQAGQRGYVITGKDRFLERYHEAMAAIEAQVDQCRKLTADNATQQQRLDKLAALIAARMMVSRETIHLRRTQGFDAARHVVETDRGRQINDRIRDLVGQMKAEENELLRQRQEQVKVQARLTRWITVLATVVACVLVAAASFLIHRDMRGRQRAEKSLAKAYAELELRVQERIADLAIANAALKREVVERGRAEEMLRESEERFKAFMNNSPVVAFMKDADGRYVYVNETFSRLFRHRLEDLREKTDFDVWPEETAKQFRENDVQALSSEHPVETFETVPAPDGSPRHWLVLKFPVREASGRKLLGGVALDITERKRADDELKRTAEDLARSNTELERFAYVSSHDLQEPLRMVASYVQLLQRRYKGRLAKEADEFITYAVDGAGRMQLLINDLLTFSRVGTQAKPLEETPCEAAFERAMANLQMAVAECHPAVTHDALPVVNADPMQLVQLFQNLVGNAVKFHNSHPPEVHVQADRHDGEWLFSVRDNGIGFDQKHAERIFTLFQRLHGREKYSGTGIGLAICKKIVERHGGRIWAESQPEKGSVFYFTLPVKGPYEP